RYSLKFGSDMTCPPLAKLFASSPNSPEFSGEPTALISDYTHSGSGPFTRGRVLAYSAEMSAVSPEIQIAATPPEQWSDVLALLFQHLPDEIRTKQWQSSFDALRA